jgi:cell wall-associated NlpC family hydrolase
MRFSGRIVLQVAATAVVASLLVLALIPMSPASGATEITDKQAQAREVADKLDGLNGKLMSLADQSEVARQRLAEANQGVDAARKRADAANAQMAQASSQLAGYAIDAYISGNDTESFNAILTSEPSDAPVKGGYVRSLTGNRADLVDRLAMAKQQAADEGARLSAQVDAAKAESDKIDVAQREADAAVAEQSQLKSQVDGELAGLLAAEQQRRDAEAAAQAAAAAKQAADQAAATRKATTLAPSPTQKPAPDPVAPPPSGPPPAPNGGAAKAVGAAMSKLGSPYVWGAAGPNTFDCSGLILWAWAQAGVSLPHYTGSQLAVSRRIAIADLQPGDLVFVWGPGEAGDPGHVGLYIGGGQMVHAPNSGSVVKVNSIYWWPGSRISAGRVG